MMLRLLLVLALSVPVSAKSLHWRALDVRAHLDRDGNLRLVEKHVMVFDGDWNGGEREFDLRPMQSLTVQKITRVEGGREITLTQGDLDAVDHWDFAGDGVVRWRSRLPEDPPFANRELTYVVEATYGNPLVAGDAPQEFVLDHDFGLPNREGVIERFSLALTFDPVWGAVQPVHLTQQNVQPGANAIVSTPLRFGGAGDPAGFRRPIDRRIPRGALAIFGAGVLLLVIKFLLQERPTGRFARIVPQFDDAVLKLRPEAAGAVWDAGIGAPEVAAVLARMTQEGKLASRAEGKTLHLTLKVTRHELTGYERELVQKLFFGGRDQTDTDSIRAHYRSTGFDPASAIRSGIEETLVRAVNWQQKVPRFRVATHAILLTIALAIAVALAFLGSQDDLVMTLIVAGATAFLTLFACLAARECSRSIAGAGTFVGAFFILLMPSLPLIIGYALASNFDLRPHTLFGLGLWTLALVNLVLDMLKIQDPPELIAFRKRIAGARRFFIRELESGTPQLRDEWFPYVLAFGLGKHVDRWFRAFGGARAGTTGTWTSSSSSSSSSSSGSSWTGGGGAFGGAGASGTWAVAAGSIAAGVAAPSSSGSGGGGGSSSGGGGGGGW